MSDSTESKQWVLRIGCEELVIRRRYEVVGIVNDFLIAMWFILGSLLFFQESTTTARTWLFLLGSCELAICPVIRLNRFVHLRRLRSAGLRGSDQEF
ncbi:YrhK family protein [Saccharopolyspora sp. NPDC002376]